MEKLHKNSGRYVRFFTFLGCSFDMNFAEDPPHSFLMRRWGDYKEGFLYVSILELKKIKKEGYPTVWSLIVGPLSVHFWRGT